MSTIRVTVGEDIPHGCRMVVLGGNGLIYRIHTDRVELSFERAPDTIADQFPYVPKGGTVAIYLPPQLVAPLDGPKTVTYGVDQAKGADRTVVTCMACFARIKDGEPHTCKPTPVEQDTAGDDPPSSSWNSFLHPHHRQAVKDRDAALFALKALIVAVGGAGTTYQQLEDAVAAGKELLVTLCPGCKRKSTDTEQHTCTKGA